MAGTIDRIVRRVPWFRHMNGFPRFIAVRRAIRIIIIVLAFLMPLTNVVSAAMLIVTARHGWRSVLLDAGASLVVLAVLLQVTGNAAPGTALVSAAGLWGGAVMSGLLLLRYRSINLVVQALVMVALLGVLAATAVIPDPRAHWQPVLEAVVKSAGLPEAGNLPANWLGTLATLMNGVIASGLLSTLILALLLGLWILRHRETVPGRAADLISGEAGGWRRQFLELRLGQVLVAASGIAALVLVAGSVSLGGSALLVLTTGFVVQGLAIVHWTADERQWPRIWPLALYGLMLLGAPIGGLMLLILAVAGIIDNAVSLRRPRSNVV